LSTAPPIRVASDSRFSERLSAARASNRPVPSFSKPAMSLLLVSTEVSEMRPNPTTLGDQFDAQTRLLTRTDRCARFRILSTPCCESPKSFAQSRVNRPMRADRARLCGWPAVRCAAFGATVSTRSLAAHICRWMRWWIKSTRLASISLK